MILTEDIEVIIYDLKILIESSTCRIMFAKRDFYEKEIIAKQNLIYAKCYFITELHAIKELKLL